VENGVGGDDDESDDDTEDVADDSDSASLHQLQEGCLGSSQDPNNRSMMNVGDLQTMDLMQSWLGPFGQGKHVPNER
jgi:hypothetical protein